MPSIGGAMASARAMSRSDRAETRLPARADTTVAPLNPAAFARSAQVHPRRASSWARASVRSAIPIARSLAFGAVRRVDGREALPVYQLSGQFKDPSTQLDHDRAQFAQVARADDEVRLLPVYDVLGQPVEESLQVLPRHRGGPPPTRCSVGTGCPPIPSPYKHPPRTDPLWADRIPCDPSVSVLSRSRCLTWELTKRRLRRCLDPAVVVEHTFVYDANHGRASSHTLALSRLPEANRGSSLWLQRYSGGALAVLPGLLGQAHTDRAEGGGGGAHAAAGLLR
jgi:hypothetical protein